MVVEASARRILVVEDDCLIAVMLCDQLVELDYLPVGPAFTLSEARHLASVSTLDAALIDLKLNGKVTEDVADILSQRNIPFVFVTGYDRPPSGHYPSIPVLRKPFSPVELKRAVEQVLPPPYGLDDLPKVASM